MRILRIVDPCDGGTLATESACFRELAPNDKDAAIVWYLWKANQATNAFSSDIQDLLAAAACMVNYPPERLHAFDVQVAVDAATAAGASVTGTISEATTGIKCLRDASPQVIRALLTVMRCKLNAAIS